MFRIVIAALIIYAIYRLWKRAGARPRATTAAPTRAGSGEMIACSACGTFVLAEEALYQENKAYCCAACTQRTKEEAS